ncbi:MULTISPECIES: type VII secretion protein EssB [Streptococcus]|nr:MULTISPECIES: type VII secretion protein EssB [Streptococcus]
METQKREWLIEDVKGNREVAYTLLTAEHPLFMTQKLIEEDGKLLIEGLVTDEYYGWDEVEHFINEEKLRHLLNISQLFSSLEDSIYTYELTPFNIVFSRNAEPLLVFKGIKGQIPPYEATSKEILITHFKAMIVSLLDRKISYERLLDGQLPFYKGNLFCEAVVKAENLNDLIALLHEKYQDEKKRNRETFSRVSNKVISRLKWATIGTSVIGFLSLLGILYFVLFAIPTQEMISELRLAFVHQDYSTVVSTVKNTDSKALSQDDKYIVAYSVIMTELLTEVQKEELSNISKQSNADYLRYWVLIGQAHIDEAMDIASYLDDPQLMMYGLTKKMDEVQRNPDLTSEERTEQLNSYKAKLEEFKKTYLRPETTESTTDSTKSR